ncbi:hypothetical protein EV644_10493 [Kribbella orskensis]|uniref:Uncharacterized protein n=1 Tax=Kribbella orskensis TaxID=2512216 RepID=A0ABY2BN67_9ACTN|nr:hypothetical protein EV642_10393 [Kribbella sp. VKM Ac-2500]TCO25589.1 hypothetical protein EV644_10493 [Kribbella orskensis]
MASVGYVLLLGELPARRISSINVSAPRRRLAERTISRYAITSELDSALPRGGGEDSSRPRGSLVCVISGVRRRLFAGD